VLLLVAGPALYRAMGGTGEALAVAVAYSRVVFGGAIALWVLNILASVVRGTGNMVLPAGVIVGGAVVTITVSPALILGWGPLPRLGVIGAGAALVTYYVVGSAIFLIYLVAGRGIVRLRPGRFRLGRGLRWAWFREILRVGVPSSINTIQTNLTVVLLTGLVGPFGTYALAGYGMGSRLEYLQIPLVFGLGSALVTLVGINLGAGQVARARRIAWIGAAIAGVATELIGVTAAVAPQAWLGLFSRHPDVLVAGTSYLQLVGPTYGFFGVGLALYFASQGAGQALGPLVAGFARLVIAALGGALLAHLAGALLGVFAAIALGLVVFGTTMAVIVLRADWRREGTAPSP
jgi:Na+-driven multidrug efflux pump